MIMRGQWQHRARESSVEVAVLLPSIADEYEVSHPPGGRRRLDRESQSYLIARVQDNVSVIHARQQKSEA